MADILSRGRWVKEYEKKDQKLNVASGSTDFMWERLAAVQYR